MFYEARELSSLTEEEISLSGLDNVASVTHVPVGPGLEAVGTGMPLLTVLPPESPHAEARVVQGFPLLWSPTYYLEKNYFFLHTPQCVCCHCP